MAKFNVTIFLVLFLLVASVIIIVTYRLQIIFGLRRIKLNENYFSIPVRFIIFILSAVIIIIIIIIVSVLSLVPLLFVTLSLMQFYRSPQVLRAL